MTDKIVVKNLSKIFGPDPAAAVTLAREGIDADTIFARTGNAVGVYDATLSIRTGEVFVVMGLSGSGKSTLVRMFNRLIEPTSGEVVIDGQNVVQMPQERLIELRRRDIAMVFQSFALLPHLNVIENAAFGLEIAGLDKKARHERAARALEEVGLSAYAESRPDELSGGMQQRVGLARALATDPSVLLMDEAFSALDPLIRREMQEELLRLQEEHERTVVFISHDLDEAMRIGDRIAIMQGGRVLQVGTPHEILERPATEYVKAFFKDVDVAQVYDVDDIASPAAPVFTLHADTTADAVTALRKQGVRFGYVVDASQRLAGMVSLDALRACREQELHEALLADEPVTIKTGTALGHALGRVARSPYPVPVLSRARRLLGVVSRTELLKALEREDG